MRIYYLSSSVVPSRAANSVHVMKMCRSLAEVGHDVVLFARPGENSNADLFDRYGVSDSFDVAFCEWPMIAGIGPFIYADTVRRRIGRLPPPDLIYARHPYSLARSAGIGAPLVYEAHAPPAHRVQALIEEWVLRRRNFARLVVISDALRKEYLRTFPRLLPEQVVVAHDASDMPSFGDASMPQWPGRAGRLQVGYVGHLYRGKGIEIILRLAERLDRIDFHVVGGTEADIEFWKGQSRTSNLHFHGHVPHGRLTAFYPHFDIMLAPYQTEVRTAGGKLDIARWMSPLKLFEYMAHAKPIVASDLPVIREVLQDGTNALLVPPPDVDGWERAVSRLQDPDLRRALGSHGRSLAESLYSWDHRARAVLEGLP